MELDPDVQGEGAPVNNKAKKRNSMKIEIYDPPMCCSTGVCGPAVDPELVRVHETLRAIGEKGEGRVEVCRFGISSQPADFMRNPEVAGLLQAEGVKVLPLVFVDGALLTRQRYPSAAEFQEALASCGIAIDLAGPPAPCG